MQIGLRALKNMCGAQLRGSPFYGRDCSDAQVSRLCAADLSIDSLVYNGMTTACDSLWANVPLVSSPGKTMCDFSLEALLARHDS
jgi:hypothetical protein